MIYMIIVRIDCSPVSLPSGSEEFLELIKSALLAALEG
jgi:hypothetical protein